MNDTVKWIVIAIIVIYAINVFSKGDVELPELPGINSVTLPATSAPVLATVAVPTLPADRSTIIDTPVPTPVPPVVLTPTVAPITAEEFGDVFGWGNGVATPQVECHPPMMCAAGGK